MITRVFGTRLVRMSLISGKIRLFMDNTAYFVEHRKELPKEVHRLAQLGV